MLFTVYPRYRACVDIIHVGLSKRGLGHTLRFFLGVLFLCPSRPFLSYCVHAAL